MTVDQANMLLFPIEIARIISVLIHGTDHAQNKEKALKQVNINIFVFLSKTQWGQNLFAVFTVRDHSYIT